MKIGQFKMGHSKAFNKIASSITPVTHLKRPVTEKKNTPLLVSNTVDLRKLSKQEYEDKLAASAAKFAQRTTQLKSEKRTMKTF